MINTRFVIRRVCRGYAAAIDTRYIRYAVSIYTLSMIDRVYIHHSYSINAVYTYDRSGVTGLGEIGGGGYGRVIYGVQVGYMCRVGYQYPVYIRHIGCPRHIGHQATRKFVGPYMAVGGPVAPMHVAAIDAEEMG